MKPLDSRQSVLHPALPNIGTSANSTVDTVFAAIEAIFAAKTGTGVVVFNTSPTLSGTIGGNLTWSGTQTISNTLRATAIGVNMAAGSTGTVSVSAPNSGGSYGIDVVGTAGGARDLAIFGQSGFSNGFQVQYDGTKMVYTFSDATATTTFAGNAVINGTAAIQTTTVASIGLNLGATLTGNTNTIGTYNNNKISSSSTNSYIGFYSNPSTQATSFTLTNLYHLYAGNAVIGSGSAISNQFGVYVENMTGAGTNYAIVTNSGLVSLGDHLEMRGSSSGAVTVSAGTAVSSYTVILPNIQGGVGTVLQNNGSGTLSWANVGTNPMTTLGDIIYGGAGGTETRLAGNTSTVKQYLTQQGTGSVSTAPVWVAPTPINVVTLTSGTSATYTPTSGVAYLKVRMVSGGGAGGSSGTGSPPSGGNGGGTTFSMSGGTRLAGLTGGGGAVGGGSNGGIPGTISAFSGFTGGSYQVAGGFGAPPVSSGGTATLTAGGNGGSSPFGGAGGGSMGVTAGQAAQANSGSGGGGAGGSATSSVQASGGGGSGAYIEFIVSSPTSATYTIGAGGTPGAAGSSGAAGAAGGSGVIIIEEHFA